jgi:hypothetical protein
MKKQTLISYEETLEFSYYPWSFDEKKGIYYWWLKDISFCDELIIKTYIEDDRKQIHLSWSRRALKELGKYLINLSNFETPDPDYHDHIDEYLWVKWNTDLIIHHSNFYEDRKNYDSP